MAITITVLDSLSMAPTPLFARFDVLRVDYSPEAVSTQHPVELGANVVDHVQTLPLTMRVDAYVTSSPLSLWDSALTGSGIGGGGGEKERRWEWSSPRLIFPTTGGRSPPAPEVDPTFAEDYAEACAILDRSPQMAATLARRILQSLLRRKGGAKKRELFDQIDEVKGTLPAAIYDNLHDLRQLGNAGAHEWTDADDEPVKPERELVVFYLDQIVMLFDHYFVAPARAQKARQGVATLLQRAGKKPK